MNLGGTPPSKVMGVFPLLSRRQRNKQKARLQCQPTESKSTNGFHCFSNGTRCLQGKWEPCLLFLLLKYKIDFQRRSLFGFFHPKNCFPRNPPPHAEPSEARAERRGAGARRAASSAKAPVEQPRSSSTSSGPRRLRVGRGLLTRGGRVGRGDAWGFLGLHQRTGRGDRSHLLKTRYENGRTPSASRIKKAEIRSYVLLGLSLANLHLPVF